MTMVPEFPYAFAMPQPVLLQALWEKGKAIPDFDIWFQSSVKELIHEGDTVTGVVVDTKEGKVEVRAKVTVGADGRFSLVRKLGGFEMEYEHYNNDVAWFTTELPANTPRSLQLVMTDSHFCLVLPKYPNSIQGGITIKKGEWKKIQDRGIQALRKELKDVSPLFHDFADSLVDFKPFTLLQAKTMFVKEWAKNGCLLVGDAAHCASPAGGVGVSLSTATAIVAADVICDAIESGDVSAKRLGRVQEIRSEDVRNVHQLQLKQEGIQMSSNPFIKAVRPYVISFLSKLPIMAKTQKKVFVMSEPLPIQPRFRLQ